MYYLYITLVLMLVASALWVILCFHYVLQQQRQLNAVWQRLHRLMLDHNALAEELLRVWAGSEAGPAGGRPAELEVLQQCLAQDKEADWQNVKERAALHQRLEQAVQQLVAAGRQNPQLTKSATFTNLAGKLEDSWFRLGKVVEQYNRSARVYNALLQQNPNRYVANKFGLVSVPFYTV